MFRISFRAFSSMPTKQILLKNVLATISKQDLRDSIINFEKVKNVRLLNQDIPSSMCHPDFPCAILDFEDKKEA